MWIAGFATLAVKKGDGENPPSIKKAYED